MTSRADQSWWILRVIIGGMGIASGIDKFTNILVDWDNYIAPFFRDLLPVTGDQFMYAVGAFEIILGIGIFTRFTQIFAYLFSAWLLAIALNLLIGGDWDIAARDVAISASAFTLAHLSTSQAVDTKRRVFGRRKTAPS